MRTIILLLLLWVFACGCTTKNDSKKERNRLIASTSMSFLNSESKTFNCSENEVEGRNFEASIPTIKFDSDFNEFGDIPDGFGSCGAGADIFVRSQLELKNPTDSLNEVNNTLVEYGTFKGGGYYITSVYKYDPDCYFNKECFKLENPGIVAKINQENKGFFAFRFQSVNGNESVAKGKAKCFIAKSLQNSCIPVVVPYWLGCKDGKDKEDENGYRKCINDNVKPTSIGHFYPVLKIDKSYIYTYDTFAKDSKRYLKFPINDVLDGMKKLSKESMEKVIDDVRESVEDPPGKKKHWEYLMFTVCKKSTCILTYDLSVRNGGLLYGYSDNEKEVAPSYMVKTSVDRDCSGEYLLINIFNEDGSGLSKNGTAKVLIYNKSGVIAETRTYNAGDTPEFRYSKNEIDEGLTKIEVQLCSDSLNYKFCHRFKIGEFITVEKK